MSKKHYFDPEDLKKFGNIGEWHVGIELPDKGLDQSTAFALDPIADKTHDFVDELLLELVCSHDMGIP